MANSRENEIPHQVARCRIPWKLLPECLRRKSDRSFAKKKKETEEIVSVSAVMLSPVSPGCEDTGEHKKDETEFETNEAKNIVENISPSSKKKLKCRKSLTYGQCHNCDRVKISAASDIDNITREEKTRHSLRRPLYREKSCHRKDNPEFLTKNEARKRLLSWQKTTIVRKNSEQQQQYSY